MGCGERNAGAYFADQVRQAQKRPAKTALLGVKKELKAHERWISVQLFSSHNHEGMDELQRTLNWWLTLPEDDVAAIEDDLAD